MRWTWLLCRPEILVSKTDRCVVGSGTYENVLNDIDFANILPKRANTDAVATVAVHILHQEFGGVWFERDAVVTIVDN